MLGAPDALGIADTHVKAVPPPDPHSVGASVECCVAPPPTHDLREAKWSVYYVQRAVRCSHYVPWALLQITVCHHIFLCTQGSSQSSRGPPKASLNSEPEDSKLGERASPESFVLKYPDT